MKFNRFIGETNDSLAPKCLVEVLPNSFEFQLEMTSLEWLDPRQLGEALLAMNKAILIILQKLLFAKA